jgi:1,4-alpha-glucan branching enzyme
MKRFSFYWVLFIPVLLQAQSKVAVDPVITPALFQPDTEITVTYDVTGTSLATLTNAWAWVWIPGKNIEAKYNINPATATADPAKFTKSVESGKTLFTLTFKPADFFNQSISNETQIGILLKGSDWNSCGAANCQTTDYLVTFWDGSFQIALTSPSRQPLFVVNGQEVIIEAEAPVAVDFDLYINDVLTDEQDGVAVFSYIHTIDELSGYGEVKLVATEGINVREATFLYLISAPSPVQARPSGTIPGINYDSNDHTKVTLCLWAPAKTSVYVRGDFSDWDVLPQHLMKRDGEFFWLEITGLTAGAEYAYQYLVNEELWLADPYSDKILDPDDQDIPASAYPGLKPYPSKALSSDWYFNRLAVFQTHQTPYVWQATDYQRPEKEKLVIYELLIRDFFANGQRHYQHLIDTLGYLKRLGVNAIELMPVTEFNGNDSWGYNPTFMFAPDKYYGSKNKLKEFIDICHQNGMAVILDMVMNHQDMPNAYVMMDFDFVTGKPTPQNKWFNVDARHPFNVFFDMNHESSYTKSYLDTVNHYWLNEYKVDGYRFDLSKGFTQTNSGGNVGAWSAYDASRVALLKRMADKIWSHSPEAYIILEHFAANNEEKELAEYRAAEGKGMLFWGNVTHSYAEATMGFADESDISSVYHSTRNWSVPHLIGYMESHDEERMMFKNLQFGKVSGSYSVKNLSNALHRVKGASTIFYTIPGPKMLWQFGELGYDISIDEGGRVSPKPVKWEYRDNYARFDLYTHIADLNRLRTTYSVFTAGAATLTAGTNLVKQLTLKNVPYTTTPVDATEMNVQVVVNFEVTNRTASVTFPHTGTWYDYYAHGEPVNVNSTPYMLQMGPGEFRIFTDVEITNPLITSTDAWVDEVGISLYPNPLDDVLNILSDKPISRLWIASADGVTFVPLRLSEDSWRVRDLKPGFYIVLIEQPTGVRRIKAIKR